MIIGCDFHPSWQQVSWLDTETGESGEQKLVQASGDAERFYRMGLQRRRERGFAPDSPQNREPARFLLLVKF